MALTTLTCVPPQASLTPGRAAVPPHMRPASLAAALAASLLAACTPAKKPLTGAVMPPSKPGRYTPDNPHVPRFAAAGWEAFARADAVAIARREWRLFGQPVDDDPPDTRPPPQPADKPERQPGLWQRVGEYWWTGIDPSETETAWTGIHDENGYVFDPTHDGFYAWSAAFISYVMRIAGAGPEFPYASSHAIYINAAAAHQFKLVSAERPSAYAPQPGDLICVGRGRGSSVRFEDLPTPRVFPAHCDMVLERQGNALLVVGGNVDDAVTAKHVPVSAEGKLADGSGQIIDTRYNWLAVLKIAYAR